MAEWPRWIWVLVSEIGHWSSVAPLLACAVLAHRRQHVTPEMWLLSAAFGVSFAADQVALRFALAGKDNMWLGLIWAPIQFGMFGAVVAPTRAVRVMVLAFLGAVTLAAALQSPAPQVSTVVQVVGGLVVAFLVWQSPTFRPYRGPVMVYGLLTLPGILVFGSVPFGSTWYAGWMAYHAARVLALLWMVRVILCPDRRGKEEGNGYGVAAITDRRRRADWADPVRSGLPVAQARRR